MTVVNPCSPKSPSCRTYPTMFPQVNWELGPTPLVQWVVLGETSGTSRANQVPPSVTLSEYTVIGLASWAGWGSMGPCLPMCHVLSKKIYRWKMKIEISGSPEKTVQPNSCRLTFLSSVLHEQLNYLLSYSLIELCALRFWKIALTLSKTFSCLNKSRFKLTCSRMTETRIPVLNCGATNHAADFCLQHHK